MAQQGPQRDWTTRERTWADTVIENMKTKSIVLIGARVKARGSMEPVILQRCSTEPNRTHHHDTGKKEVITDLGHQNLNPLEDALGLQKRREKILNHKENMMRILHVVKEKYQGIHAIA